MRQNCNQSLRLENVFLLYNELLKVHPKLSIGHTVPVQKSSSLQKVLLILKTDQVYTQLTQKSLKYGLIEIFFLKLAKISQEDV